jgi:hypothetical protein
MGLIAKQKTKSRTAATQHSANLSTDWAGQGIPHMATIVRAAACSVAQRQNLRSSGFRGRDTLGIGSAMRSGDSTIWVEQAGFDDWAIGLGLETVKGRALDWGLKFHTSRSPQVSVSITTPAVLTKDGSQVHKDEYLEARELVVAGLTASAPPPPMCEIGASQRGLSMASPELHRTVAAQAPILQSSDSILAPLLIGIRGPKRGTSLASVVSTACNAVPAVSIMRKRMQGRKAVAIEHAREVVYWQDNTSAGYKVLARCIDRAVEETPAQAFGRWVWEVGLFCFRAGNAPAPIAADQESFRADVTRFKLRNQGVMAAQQLALFRHFMAEGFCALDPVAVIHGGQRV